jgi:ATP:ADP antiporter, AAA family
MIPRLRRFFDVRPGEGLPVLLTFLYIAVVVAAFLLAKPIRNGLFLQAYGPQNLVYVYAAVPLVLSLFVPAYTRVTARFGSRAVTAGTLLFFCLNALWFWSAFRSHRVWLLPGLFYVWVNCFGIIAPVQAWSYANSLFDTRQAKRLFGLIGSGASLGAIMGGILARFLVGPLGGSVNLLLVLAGLILAAALVVLTANRRIPRKGLMRRGRPVSHPFRETLRDIGASPYLRLMAVLVFLVAISTQWIGLQLNFVADARYGGDADSLTRFFGTFNFLLGSVSFVVQIFVTSRALRTFGLAVTILTLPIALGAGTAAIIMIPAFWPVLATNAFDQGLRFSVDKPTYELLYLPIAPALRAQVKNAIDIVGNRIADALGAVLFGVATGGFFMLPGVGLSPRGTAVLNLMLISVWMGVALRLRTEYVRTIQASIHRHRLDTERTSASVLERSASDVLKAKLGDSDPDEVKYALGLLEVQQTKSWHPALRALLTHPDPNIRRRALALLSAAGDRDIADRAVALLRDQDLGVRTEALLYLSREMGIDPLSRIQELGEFEDFSIRAGMAAFLSSPGPSQNLEAARTLLDGMVHSPGHEGARDRAEAARLLAMVPAEFGDLLAELLVDDDEEVARLAIRSARVVARDELAAPLMLALGRPYLADEAAEALSRLGPGIVPQVAERLSDESTDVEVRRELPTVLVRIGTPEAEQVLVRSLLSADTTLRHRVIASLNKLRNVHPDVRIEPATIEILLAAEIAGHYRSYQVLGPLQAQLKDTDPVLQALRHSMEQELERIFRLMALLYPQAGLHDAYVGLRAANPIVRANALEFLDNVLRPELRQILVPLLDAQVTIEERIEIGNRLVGAPLESTEAALATLLASEDSWLRSCAIYAVGTLQVRGLEDELIKFEATGDPILKESIRVARQRLAGRMETAVGTSQEPAPPDLSVGVGAG